MWREEEGGSGEEGCRVRREGAGEEKDRRERGIGSMLVLRHTRL